MSDLYDSDSNARGEPRAAGPSRASRRYYGKYAGLVSDNAAQDGAPHRGELKVKVPGILEETPDGEGNQPIEVLAAPAFLPGYFFIPDTDAQVWVEFVAGDINFPIWTGVWYPKDQPPKDSDDAAPTEDTKVIRTRSGHVVLLDDTDDGERIVIKDAKNKNTITMDKDGIVITQEGQSATGTITMSADGVKIEFGKSSLTIADETITLTSKAVDLDAGTGKITVKADTVAVTVSTSMDVS